MKFSKKIVLFIIIANVIFTAAVLCVAAFAGIEVTTICICWFAFTGTELVALTSIKNTETKEFKKSPNKQRYDDLQGDCGYTEDEPIDEEE